MSNDDDDDDDNNNNNDDTVVAVEFVDEENNQDELSMAVVVEQEATPEEFRFINIQLNDDNTDYFKHDNNHEKETNENLPASSPVRNAPSSIHCAERTQPPENLVLWLDPDGQRRRQLVLSLLGTVAATVWMKETASARTMPLRPNATENRMEHDETLVTSTTSTTTTILKPPLDDRDYRALTLPNDLRVLLASDPSSRQAAAAMNVHVGAMSDPVTIPGLAHFTEHMLFLGTKPFPQEDSFERFLATNGGSSNAYTDSENTVYYFDLEAADEDRKLAEALLRFGSFFSAPLFTESATSRELNAIDSENAKNLQSDVFRVFQLEKARAQMDHPFHKFFTGNKATLLDGTKEQGINLRNELIHFYQTYYSANQMTLAVVGPQSLDQLEKMVLDAFGNIPNRRIAAPEQTWKGILPFALDHSVVPSFGYVLEIVPVQDIRQVTLTWPLVYTSDQDQLDSLLIKPSTYVAHLLGHEGPRSLLSYLKGQGWANSLAADSEERLSDFETFQIVVGLTTQGLAALDRVVEAVFSYITMLRDEKTIPNYIFEEVLQLDELQWRFANKGNLGGYVQSLATAMQKFSPELYVAGPRRIAVDNFEYGDVPLESAPRSSFSSKQQLERTKSAVEHFIKALTVENLMVTVLSQSFEGQTHNREKWYGTEYNVRPISSETLEQWQHPTRASKLKIDLPKPNPFIPSEAGLMVKKEPSPINKLLHRTFDSRMEPLAPPTIIRDDARWTVHFKQDDRFGQPKGYVIFEVLTKEAFASPEQAALSNLFEISVSDRLGEYAYDGKGY